MCDLKKPFQPLLLLLAICLFSLQAEAKYGGGIGEPNDPYRIDTAADLILLGDSPEDYDKHFILTADIDLDPNLPGRKVFDKSVVAQDMDPNDWRFQGTSFTGVFDGNGHTISNLTYDSNGVNSIGLFGYVNDPNAEIKDLGLIDPNIDAGTGDYIGSLVGYLRDGTIIDCYVEGGSVSGDRRVGGLIGRHGLPTPQHRTITSSHATARVAGYLYVGGLVGENTGKISDCYSGGRVSGYSNVGGLVGSNEGSITTSYITSTVVGETRVGGLVGNNWRGRITNCYSAGSVSGDEDVGGLVGRNIGRIATSYSTGTVTGNEDVGGLVGSCHTNEVYSSFWDIDMSGQTSSAGGVGLTTDEMMDPYMLGLNGFANDPNWVLDAGRDYPRLAWEDTVGQIIPEPNINGVEGHGTAQNPYRIETADQLIFLIIKTSILWDRHFVLCVDIDLDPNLPNVPIFRQAPIPVFTGVFDGNGHTISHLTVTGRSYLGLFGRLESGAEVKDLGVVDVNISGSDDHVGGLVGYSQGDITNCHSTGTDSGDYHVGGLIGTNEGSVSSCCTNVYVDGVLRVGGLMGTNRGSVTMSYNSGAVTGVYEVGGLVGANHRQGSITTSYSTGAVTANRYVGGLVGENYGSIAASYSTGTVSGGRSVGGLIGYNDGLIYSSYSTGAVSGDSDVGGLIGIDWQEYEFVIGCFWDIWTSGQTTSDGGVGKTTAEMQAASTFLEAGWDFVGETANGTEDIWWILEGQDYPRLWWELIAGDSTALSEKQLYGIE